MDPLIRDSNKPSAAAGIGCVCGDSLCRAPSLNAKRSLKKTMMTPRKARQPKQKRTHAHPLSACRRRPAAHDCRADQQSQHQHKVHVALKCMRHDAVAGAEHDFE